MTIVTRFPPSPTGFMHIGNARTALFNWLYAKRHGGKFLVRIEDTDRKRHSEEAVQAIINGLKWLELDHDGDIVSQFANQARHREVAEELVNAGKAYHCYCSPEDLQTMREAGHGYDRRWRDRDPSEAPAGVDPVIRIKAPLEGAITIEDKVQGTVTVSHENLDDFILLRSDGTPTYMLSVVVDDHDMGVTHVIRGDDHLNNAFRQTVIFQAMGWDVPIFAHLPLIHGPDGGKFSKRHGATSVEEYRDMGYLPEAMRNYLLRLGWSHGDDEIISTAQAIEWFNLENIGKSAARFDFDKLENLNAHYIKDCDDDRLMNLVRPLYPNGLSETGETRIRTGMEELKSRSKTLIQFVEESLFYEALPETFTDKAQNLVDNNQDILKILKDELATISAFQSADVQNTCKVVAGQYADGKLGKVAMPLRAALTGTTASPSIFHAAEILGQEEVNARLTRALKMA